MLKTSLKFETVYTSSSFLKIIKSLGVKFEIQNRFLNITCDGGAATGSTAAKLITKKYNLAFCLTVYFMVC